VHAWSLLLGVRGHVDCAEGTGRCLAHQPAEGQDRSKDSGVRTRQEQDSNGKHVKVKNELDWGGSRL